MSINLKCGLIIVSLLLFILVIIQLRKKRIPVKYSLLWMMASLLIFLIALIPKIFIKLSSILGFVTMSNMVIGIFIFILLIISLTLTVIVSDQRKKINLLIQEVSMVKEKNEK